MKSRYIAILMLLLVALGCTKNDEQLPAIDGSGQAAQFNVSTIDGILWDTPLTRSDASIVDTMLLDDLYLVTAECGQSPYQFVPDSVPLTRGTPITNAPQLKNIGIAIFNSEESALTSVTPLWKNIQATNNNGSWQNSQSIVWPSGTTNLSFMAYSPTVGAAVGTSLSADGRTITYTAPTDVTKQPDICVATPILNRTNADKSGGHLVNFEMRHSLAAIGIKASGNKIKIKSITFSGIASSGALNIENGTWSGVGSKQSFAVKVKADLESVPIADIMVSDGYLMVPPQTLGDDAVMTLIFDDLATGKTNLTKSVRLNTFASLKQWLAGQFIYYNIQLKANFALTISPMTVTLPAPAGRGEMSYTTNSPIKITAATNVAWIKNVEVNTATKKITYSYDVLSTNGDRVGKISVTTGHTKVETTLTQQKPYLTLSATAPGEMIPMTGKSYKITVSSNVSWKATGSNATVSPASGSAGTTEVTIIVGPYSAAASRAISASFTTDAGGVTQKWSGPQAADIFSTRLTGPDLLGTSVGKNVYVSKTNGGDIYNYSEAIAVCAKKGSGFRIPNIAELQAIVKGAPYQPIESATYWSTTKTTYNTYYVYSTYFGTTEISDFGADYYAEVRCVIDIP